MTKMEKAKAWFERNKEAMKTEAVRLCWLAVGAGVGCFVTNKISDISFAAGLERFHHDGVLKFFDPATGLEVCIEKAVEIITDKYKK